jgi:Fibronectin type III domain
MGGHMLSVERRAAIFRIDPWFNRLLYFSRFRQAARVVRLGRFSGSLVAIWIAIGPSIALAVHRPIPPPNLRVTSIRSGQISLQWDSSDEAINYTVMRGLASGGPFTSATIRLGNVTSVTDSGLMNGTAYYYVVRASNAAGTSGNSNQVEATPAPPPSTPTGLAASAGDWRVTLVWSPATDNPTSYSLKRSTTNGGPYATVYSGSATTYIDDKTPNFAAYYYRVSASNASGQSADSAQVTAAPASACGQLGTSCGTATGACTQAPSCQAQGIVANQVGFSVAAGTISPQISLGPIVTSTTNMDVEAGTVNIPGVAPIAADMNTIVNIYRQPGNALVATNDDWHAGDVRSYASYTDRSPLNAAVSYSITVACKPGSVPRCAGLVGFRITDLTRTFCPAQVLLAAGTVCRAASDSCDIAETCNGRTPDCPADAVYDDHHVCRASSDKCDIEERCTGTSKACPTDRTLPAGTVCRPSTNACDVAELCDGNSKTCPADTFVFSGLLCRRPFDHCDICGGRKVTLPGDMKQIVGGSLDSARSVDR